MHLHAPGAQLVTVVDIAHALGKLCHLLRVELGALEPGQCHEPERELPGRIHFREQLHDRFVVILGFFRRDDVGSDETGNQGSRRPVLLGDVEELLGARRDHLCGIPETKLHEGRHPLALDGHACWIAALVAHPVGGAGLEVGAVFGDAATLERCGVQPALGARVVDQDGRFVRNDLVQIAPSIRLQATPSHLASAMKRPNHAPEMPSTGIRLRASYRILIVHLPIVAS